MNQALTLPMMQLLGMAPLSTSSNQTFSGCLCVQAADEVPNLADKRQ